MLIDVPSTPQFLVDVFSFVVHAEFEVSVLALEEFRWKIFLDEDLEPLVVLVSDFGECDSLTNPVCAVAEPGAHVNFNRDRARLVSSNRESFAYQRLWAGTLRGQLRSEISSDHF